jgi:pimeloyl-ACP methyl ester carboxylesterase
MTIEKISIKNRHSLKLVIQVDTPEHPKNLVFIAHGQGGYMGQNHIQAFADSFLENNFRVIRFDATHSIGESEGDIFDVTYTGYIEDLEDVINWSRTQNWFQTPFALCGHSMGGTSTAWYAETHPEEVLCLAPIALVPNFDMYNEFKKQNDPGFMEDWQVKGYFENESRSKPGLVKRVGWGVAEDLKKYDVVAGANKLTMPVLLMAGDNDDSTPYKHQEVLFEKIPSKDKQIIKIHDAQHSFWSVSGNYEPLNEVKAALSSWLRDLIT